MIKNKGTKMKTYKLHFRYENIEFEGILEYEERSYMNFIDKKVYKLNTLCFI